MRPVGIDLGTTYSAVAYPEQRAGAGFCVLPQCPDVSLILDKLGRRIQPSVVAEDAQGNIVVGQLAKARAGLAPEPIMFAKRAMGEDRTFPLARHGPQRPEQVSGHILAHLKAIAEERLGEKVEEAVITVPAYFSMRAIQMTERAGELAGLRVSHVAQEPVAAALMYFAGDRRDPLRIMTYDLGGGTFDVAILEKRDGVISRDSILAYDGDRFLGGYNFDKTLALWIVDQLCARGYDLRLDLENPAHRVIFAKLMVIAEAAKIRLSDSDVHVICEPATGIVDHSGSPVGIDGIEVTRQQFEGMIRAEVEYTMQICRRARTEKASKPIRQEDIDEIIMVGGSSRIPLVARRLEQEYGRKPKLVEPDLCVALGAAIIAQGLGSREGNLTLDPVPRETDLPELTVTGKIAAGGAVRQAAGCILRLRADDGSFDRSRTTPADGAFAFDGISLAPEQTTSFTLTATSGAATVATRRFSVRQTATPTVEIVQAPPNMLAKPINVLLASGPREVVPVRTPLPHKVVFITKTVDNSGAIRIPILEDNNTLGEIVMREVPTSLPLGTAVTVELSLTAGFQIHAVASVSALGRDTKAVVTVPPPAARTRHQLQCEFELLSEEVDDSLLAAGPGVMFQDALAKRLRDRLAQCREMLQAGSPDLPRIADCLDEVQTMARRLSGFRPEPPRAVVVEKAEATAELIKKLIAKQPETRSDGYEQRLSAIRKEADDAHKAQNPALWKESYERLVELHDSLDRMLNRSGGDTSKPSPAEALLELSKAMAALRPRALERGRMTEFEQAAESLRKIDPKTADAWNKIRDWYVSKFEPLLLALDVRRSAVIGLTEWEGRGPDGAAR